MSHTPLSDVTFCEEPLRQNREVAASIVLHVRRHVLQLRGFGHCFVFFPFRLLMLAHCRFIACPFLGRLVLRCVLFLLLCAAVLACCRVLFAVHAVW